MCTDLITASGERSLTTRPSSFASSTTNGSTMAISSARLSSVTARPHRSRVATVPGSSRSIRASILPPSSPLSITPWTS